MAVMINDVDTWKNRDGQPLLMPVGERLTQALPPFDRAKGSRLSSLPTHDCSEGNTCERGETESKRERSMALPVVDDGMTPHAIASASPPDPRKTLQSC